MNQENAPHMQPMEQMGMPAQAQAPEAPNAPGVAGHQTAQPVQSPIPTYGHTAGQQPVPYPTQGNGADAPYPAAPWPLPYGGYPQQAAYSGQAGYPTMMQPAMQMGYPPQQPNGASALQGQEQPTAEPNSEPGQTSLPAPAPQQAAWGQQAFYAQQMFPQAVPANTVSTPQGYPAQTAGAAAVAVQPQAPIATQPAAQHPEQPFVPSFVKAANYNESYAHTMNGGIVEAGEEQPATPAFDYHYINSPARIAIYDSLKTAPRVIQVQGGPTHEYIEHIASLTYKNAKEAGGMIPYTVIREVSENFIHAKFNEVVVSIFDQGNTIRFADQGPGIKHKDLVQEPGFSSAIEPMKRYIRGVGSGLPIVKDYLSTSHGHIEIKDNVNQGSVVTISLVASRTSDEEIEALQVPDLTENEAAVLKALLPNNTMGVSEVSKATEIAVASVHTAFSKMEEAGLVEKVNKKRTLTARGTQVALSL